MVKRGEVLDTKRASWGGLLRKAHCRMCGEICWFSGTRFYCDDCLDPGRRPQMPLIPNSAKLKPSSDDE